MQKTFLNFFHSIQKRSMEQIHFGTNGNQAVAIYFVPKMSQIVVGVVDFEDLHVKEIDTCKHEKRAISL